MGCDDYGDTTAGTGSPGYKDALRTNVDPRWWKVPGKDEYVKCEVCQQHNAIGVASVPGVPYSAAYCQECVRANAHPYWLVVRNTALIGGLDNAAPWWREIVRGTLEHLGKTQQQFDADLAEDVAEIARQEAQYEAEAEAEAQRRQEAGDPSIGPPEPLPYTQGDYSADLYYGIEGDGR